jgi:hypothetical protein
LDWNAIFCEYRLEPERGPDNIVTLELFIGLQEKNKSACWEIRPPPKRKNTSSPAYQLGGGGRWAGGHRRLSEVLPPVIKRRGLVQGNRLHLISRRRSGRATLRGEQCESNTRENSKALRVSTAGNKTCRYPLGSSGGSNVACSR